MEKLKEEVGKEGLKWSVTENGKKCKHKMVASCGYLEEEVRQFSREKGVTMADSVETLGVDLRTRVRRLGAREKSKRKTCKVRFSIIKKNNAFQKNYMKAGVKNLLRAGYGTSPDLGSPCGGNGCHGERRRTGLKSIAMWPGRSSWQKAGRKRDYSILAGRMLVNVKHVNWRKSQMSTGCTTVQNVTKSGGRFRRLS